MPVTQHLIWNLTDADWEFNIADAFLGNSTDVDGLCSWNATDVDGFGTLQWGIPRNLTSRTVFTMSSAAVVKFTSRRNTTFSLICVFLFQIAKKVWLNLRWGKKYPR